MMTSSGGRKLLRAKAWREGFSLLELLVAMAVFLIISSVAFTLFNRHQTLLSQEQVTVGLNIGLRNALAQIQLDLVNAGNGLNPWPNIPAWPVGVTIVNSNPTPAQCNPTASLPLPPVYAAACFDQMNVIVVDPNTPAIHPCAAAGCTLVTSTGSTITLLGPPPPPFSASQVTGFRAGDQVLFVQSCAAAGGKAAVNSSGCMFTTATLTAVGPVNTAAPGCAAGCVNLTFNSTLTPIPLPPPPPLTTPPTPPTPPTWPYPGSNTPCPVPPPSPNTCNDPLNMTTYAPATELTDTFGPGDWVVRLLPITYSVNTSNPNDPQLVRAQAGTQNVLMDQVVGFKVGAALWNNNNTSTFQYNYSAANYTTGSNPPGTNAYQFNLIRSVRVSVIGRTQPDPTNPYKNAYDHGPYEIRGNSIIVDPRNLTMNSD